MRTLVVIPTYNERATLPHVVQRVLGPVSGAPAGSAAVGGATVGGGDGGGATADGRTAEGARSAGRLGGVVDVLVVDDASPDGTGAVADALAAGSDRVHVLHRPAKRGLGSAYLDGFAWALARDYEAVGEMDADLSHDPTDLPRLLTALQRADMAVGSRYVVGGGVRAWPAHRRALSRGGNAYVRLLTGLPVADATAGYRLYRRSVLEAVDLAGVRAEGYAFQLDMALRAWRHGFRIVEVPIVFTERTQGASKMSRAIVAEALWRVLVWGLTGPRGPDAVHPDSVVADGGGSSPGSPVAAT